MTIPSKTIWSPSAVQWTSYCTTVYLSLWAPVHYRTFQTHGLASERRYLWIPHFLYVNDTSLHFEATIWGVFWQIISAWTIKISWVFSKEWHHCACIAQHFYCNLTIITSWVIRSRNSKRGDNNIKTSLHNIKTSPYNALPMPYDTMVRLHPIIARQYNITEMVHDIKVIQCNMIAREYNIKPRIFGIRTINHNTIWELYNTRIWLYNAIAEQSKNQPKQIQHLKQTISYGPDTIQQQVDTTI